MADFVHLHLHSEYSLLDGAVRIRDIAEKAKACHHTAVALTDHGVMYGAVEFYNALKKEGVKPIVGCEVYVAPRTRFDKAGRADSSGHHLILLCKNEVGYRNLCYMVSESFTSGFYMKPRVDKDLLRGCHEGLVALSACLAGEVPSYLLAGSYKEAKRAALEMQEIFGEDYYLEVQDHGMDDERRVALSILQISRETGIPLVATNDVHYLERRDADTQAIMLCIQTGNVITDGRPIGFSTDEYYYKSTEQMEKLFAAFPGAVENTVKIAEKCNFDFTFGELHLPTYTPPKGQTHKDKLFADALAGFSARIAAGDIVFDRHTKAEYEERMTYELSVIDKMGFDAYFLIVADFVSHAKAVGIPVGPGRGSGAGSLVAFCVGITDVDPLRYDLLFERFLNPERVSMPDFDIDFCYERREEVIEYVKEKYGSDKVAQIVTFGTMAARAAVRDVGRALGVPLDVVSNVAKHIPRELDVTIDSALAVPELKTMYDSDETVRKIIDVSRALEGMPRHASTHAAGVVMTEKPTYEYVPLSSSGTGTVTQYDMTTDAALGLVKFDFLGLRYLTVISDAEREVKKRVPNFDIRKIPTDDKATYALLSDGKTDGVFQLESGGMKQVLSRLAPSTLEDIIATIALYRPGPMDSIDKFIARKAGREPVSYRIPDLAPILDVTYGCIVYQEQVMQICRALAGYSYARADIVRRAMAKKKADVMEAERADFVAGAVANGYKKEDVVAVFDEMVGFAKYAFNKSHATAYGLLSYRTAYLKAHYPAEYFAALLSSVLENTTKIRGYISDATRGGTPVGRPDVNLSSPTFSAKDGKIVFGLLAIRGVGRPFAEAVERERNKSGAFRSFDDFASRMSSSDFNRRTAEALIKAGAFDSLGVTRRALLLSYDAILSSEQDKRRNNLTGQIDMFSMGGDVIPAARFDYPQVEEFSPKELLLLEKEASGMYFSGHPLDDYAEHIKQFSPVKTSDIQRDAEEEGGTYLEQKITLCGILLDIRERTTKKGDRMANLRLDDSYGEIEILAFPKIWEGIRTSVAEGDAVACVGVLTDDEGEAPKLRLSVMTPLKSNSEMAASSQARLFIRLPVIDEKRVAMLRRRAILHPGTTPVVLFDESTKSYRKIAGLSVDPTEKLTQDLKQLFGAENVIFR